MLKSLLVGVDGSACSDVAVELGIRWAQAGNLFLVGLGVVAGPRASAIPLGGGFLMEKEENAVARAARIRVEQALGRFSIRCAEAQVSSKVLEEIGDPVEQLAEEAQRFDLVVLGHETFFDPEDPETPDGTLVAAIKRCPRPIVRAPKTLRRGTTAVLAYDGSAGAARAAFALRACRPPGIDAVRVVTVAEDRRVATRHADRAAEYLAAEFGDVKVDAIVGGSVVDGVLGALERHSAGLLATGAFGHAGLRDLFFGSTTRILLAQAPTPLLITP